MNKKIFFNTKWGALINSFLTSWSDPIRAAIFGIIAYSLFAFYRGSPWSLSNFAYFNYLADAFLHGQIFLRFVPPSIHDLSIYNGHYYLYWPPFPAILLMPFVALFGIHVSDVMITIIIGGVNVGLVAAILKAGNQASLFNLSKLRRALLVVFFAIGTVQITLATRGKVWTTAQEIGFMLVALTYLIALKFKGGISFLLAGVCMACALATRNHLIFAGIWPAWYMIRKNWTGEPRKMVGYGLLGLVPVVISGVLLIYYNIARFGDPLEFGIAYHNMAEIFKADYLKYGAFNLHYVPINLYYQYISYPFFQNNASFFQGGSLFLLSPVFFGVFSAIWIYRKEISTWMLLISIVLVNIPILLLMGTGWVQFGPRYSLDFSVPLLILTAMGIQGWKRFLLVICFLISVIHYVTGFIVMRIALGS